MQKDQEIVERGSDRCTWGLRLREGSETQILNLHIQIRQNYGIFANFGLKYRIFRPNMQKNLGLRPIFEGGSEIRPNSEAGSETS